MSRIGRQPVILPKEVKAKKEGVSLLIEGKKGNLSLEIPCGISIELESDKIIIKRNDDSIPLKSLHGTIRALINNNVKGVTEGFKKELDIIGVGYKAALKGRSLVLNIGFSHPVEFVIPADLKITTPTLTRIVIEGIDKQKVGELAAKIRRVYPPEPYKGKGIRYYGEEVRKKIGKALAK